MSEIALRFELDSGATAPRLAREAVRPLMRRIGAEALGDLELVLSELTTNAVTFGPGFAIHVEVEVDADGGVRGFVDDGGFKGVAIAEDGPITAQGLGLQIVDALTVAWGVEPETTRVWFELAPGRVGGGTASHAADAERC